MSMCLYHLAIYRSLRPAPAAEILQGGCSKTTKWSLGDGDRYGFGVWLGGGVVSLEKPKKTGETILLVLPHRPLGISPTKHLSTFPFAVPLELAAESFFCLRTRNCKREGQTISRPHSLLPPPLSLSSHNPPLFTPFIPPVPARGESSRRNALKFVSLLTTSFLHLLIFPPASFASLFHLNIHLFTTPTSPSSLQSWRPRQPHRPRRPTVLLLQRPPPPLLEQDRS